MGISLDELNASLGEEGEAAPAPTAPAAGKTPRQLTTDS